MAGQPIPPTITEAFALNAPECTQAAPVAGGKTFPFPAPSQIGTLAGAASLNDGFVPLNMTDPTAGGVPPFGPDMNGILYLLSAWVAAFAAGQLAIFNSTLATAMNGYALGALVAKSDGSGFWMNLADGNMTNPDTGGGGWIDWIPGGVDYMSATIPAGTTNNFAPPGFGPSIGFVDVNPTAGPASITGWAGGVNGQTVTVTNINATNDLELLALNSGSLSANQFRSASDITLKPNQSIDIRKSTGAGLWIVVP